MEAFIGSLIDQFTGAALAALVAVAVALLTRLLQRVGLDVDANRKAQLEYVAKQAAASIEERAAAALKARTGFVIDSATKMRQAIEEVTARLPNVSREEARMVIEAVLPSLHIGAAAGVQELGKAMRTAEEVK